MSKFKIILTISITILMSFGVNATDEKSKKIGQFLGAKETKMPDWFHKSFLDLAEDVGDSSDTDKRLMVYFHQDGCPYCNLLITKNFTNKTIKNKLQTSFNVLEINMWGDREVANFDGKTYSEKDFAMLHQVQFTPTILLFDEQGKEVLRLNGYLPIPDFNITLDYVIGRFEKTTNYRDYLAKNRTDKFTNELINEPDLFEKPPFILLRSKKSKPLVVFFETKNCQNCERLHKKVLADETTRELLKKMQVVQLDMNSDTKIITPKGMKTTAKKWAKKLNVDFSPSVILFDETGNEIIRTEAEFRIFHFQSVMDYAYSGKYKTEKSFQRYLTKRSEHIRETGKDVNIWQQ